MGAEYKPAASKMNTVTVPSLGDKNPATLYIAAEKPLRILVRNVGGVLLSLSHDSSTLQSAATAMANTFRLPPGASEVFVLMPKEGLYACGAGAGGIASIAISEALPLTMEA